MMLARCANCGRVEHIDNLDSKPSRFAGPGRWWERLPVLNLRADAIDDALWKGEDFDRIECQPCYGPGFHQGFASKI